jgi:hypothetical protein
MAALDTLLIPTILIPVDIHVASTSGAAFDYQHPASVSSSNRDSVSKSAAELPATSLCYHILAPVQKRHTIKESLRRLNL